MSFIDRLRGKKDAQASAREIADDLGVDVNPPRPEHYQMAHSALRGVSLADPLQVLAICGSEKADEYIAALFNRVCEICDTPDGPGFSAGDIKSHAGRVGKYPAVIFSFPEPKQTAEAFLTALVVLVDLDDPAETAVPQDAKGRYFTLEKGVDDNGRERTVFCEWRDDSHLNMGDGPQPTLKDFAGRIEKSI